MSDDRIQISSENPWYWEYEGEQTLLLGATNDDNLYQWSGETLTDHLDELASVGGNYVRNTMSIRYDDSVFAFAEVDGEDEVYDLDEWNDEHWDRLDTFLEETSERDIVVELTLWDQHDFGSGLWEIQPWNPENNVNYTAEETGVTSRNPFYATVENGVDEVLEYQEKFVEKVLDVSLEYDNVIYNVNNESTVPYKIDNPKEYDSTWERHWAEFVRDAAAERGVDVDVGNMIMQPHHSVAAVVKHPDLYSYAELSQLNQDSQGEVGQAHWDALQSYQAVLDALGPRPINNVKVYGATDPNPSAGEASEAVERFWRLVVGGSASARFHRNGTYGLGLVDRTKAAIRSMRMLTDEVDVFSTHPANYMLANREDNEAYCAADPGEQYAVYFPDGGNVSIDLEVTPEEARLRWLDVDASEWHAEETTSGEQWLDLDAPGDGNWAVAIHVE